MTDRHYRRWPLQSEELDQTGGPEGDDEDCDPTPIRTAVPPEEPGEPSGCDEESDDLDAGREPGEWQDGFESKEDGKGDRKAQPCWQA